MSKNEQFDFNSYVFKKYYQPKEKNNGKPHVREQEKKANDNSLNKQSDKISSVIVNTIKEEIQKCKEDINTNKTMMNQENKNIEHDCNKDIIDQINDEITNSLINQKKSKQEEYKKMLDEQNIEKQRKREEENAKNSKTLIDTTINPSNNTNNKLIQSKEGDVYMDDYQIAKQEKEREKMKRIEYSKLLHEQIEEQKRFKAQAELKKSLSKTNNPNHASTIPQHPQPHLRHYDPYMPIQLSQQPTQPCGIEAIVIDNDNPYMIQPNRSIACKTPQETQQVFSTYTNILSNFCDKRLEKYQNTQMIFKPYEKMLNDLIDVKINQLNPSSPYQDQEQLPHPQFHENDVNDIQFNEEIEKHNSQQEEKNKAKTVIPGKLKPVNKGRKQMTANPQPKRNNNNMNGKTIGNGQVKKNGSSSLGKVSNGRLLKTAEPSIRKNNNNKGAVSNTKIVKGNKKNHMQIHCNDNIRKYQDQVKALKQQKVNNEEDKALLKTGLVFEHLENIQNFILN